MSYRSHIGVGSPKEGLSILLDVGSSSASGALVRFSKTDQPTVIYTHRESVVHQSGKTSAQVFDDIYKALDRVLDKISEYVKKHEYHTRKMSNKVRSVQCVFSSPWFLSKTKVYKLKQDNPIKFTHRMMDDVLNKEEAEIVKESAGAKGQGSELQLIDKKIVQVKLNGYETSDPYDKEASEIEISTIMSFVPKSIFDKTKDLINQKYRYQDLQFQAFSVILFAVTRDIFSNNGDFILLDVSGEVTDISIAKKGVILESVSFPLGKNFMLRELSGKFGIAPNLAASIIKLHSEGKSSKEMTEKVSQVVETSKRKWLDIFEKTLINFGEELFLPRFIYVTVNNDLGAFFAQSVQNDDYRKFTITGEPFVINILNAEKVSNYCKYDSRVTKNAFVSVESIYFNNIFKLS